MKDYDMIRWMEYDGAEFLMEIGLKKDDHFLDFGCRHGTYSIPAAKLIGENGRVYAVDKNKHALDELMKKSSEQNLYNITAINGDESVLDLFEKHSFDMILLYDVYHLIKERISLIKGFHDLLTPSGIFSIYPRHHTDWMNMDEQDIITEIESGGFQFLTAYQKPMMHDDKLLEDKVYNFRP
jgi:ubiquinone/menaquinone biosynthesis C-methylase UbiE